ncbi:hypothetical protein F4815DRAFT_487268 [Daldinia loculata]|nr:hypothetical protein F4815DRAFT_487268 [Daldinia loculata]
MYISMEYYLLVQFFLMRMLVVSVDRFSLIGYQWLALVIGKYTYLFFIDIFMCTLCYGSRFKRKIVFV